MSTAITRAPTSSFCMFLRSKKASTNEIKLGYTASGQKIMAYRIMRKIVKGDDGNSVPITNRRYVVKKGPGCYALEWEIRVRRPKCGASITQQYPNHP